MFAYSYQTAVYGLCVLSALWLSNPVSGEKVLESPGMIQDLREALAELAGEGRSYLGRLAGEQTLLSVHKVMLACCVD